MSVEALIASCSDAYPVVMRADLLAAGVGQGQIRARLRSGRLMPLYPGVYSLVEPRHLSVRARLHAAQRALDGTIDGPSALVLWRAIEKFSKPIHVAVPVSGRRSPPDVIARRLLLDPRDVTEVHGIRVTTPERAFVSAAAVLKPRTLEQAFRHAEALELLTAESTGKVVERLPLAPGRAFLAAIIGGSARGLTRSTLEQDLDPLIRESGLPLPLRNAIVAGEEADFWWPPAKLIVEADHSRYHRGVVVRRVDLRKRQAWRAAGIRVVVLDELEINTPGVAVARIGLELGQRLVQNLT